MPESYPNSEGCSEGD